MNGPYDPCAIGENPPDPGPLPALQTGFVTFGSLNGFNKINDEQLEWWAEILNSVAASRLMLLAPEGSARERVLDRMEKLGVDESRVRFVPFLSPADYFKAFQEVDICLDTLPYSGHTTTLDSLWMGVPVVTSIGRTAAGRATWSVLNNIGLPGLAANNGRGYCDIARRLAADLPILSDLRRTLRGRLAASPIMDHKGFARRIEEFYRVVWSRWLSSPNP